MKRLVSLTLLTLSLVILASPASAQGSLRFEVPKVDLGVFVQKDASARLVYDIEFANVRGSPTNFVDIGLPHGNYDKDSLRASMNGAPVTSLSSTPSDILKHGVTADLGAGSSFEGDFHFEVTVRDLVFQDSTDDELASFEITPTWFGSQYVVGTTDLTISVHLPPGIDPDAVLWHKEKPPFDNKRTEGDTVIVEWHFPTASFTGERLVGVSFPKSAMDRIVVQSGFDRFFGENPGMRFLSGVLFIGLFALAFFRFTGGTGIVVFIPFLVVFCIIAAVSPVAHLALWPVLLMAAIWAEWMVRKRRSSYLPPLATVEGGGVKDGFAAPEAAVILELPLSTVCSLVLAGLLKKGLLRPAAGDRQLLEMPPEFRGTRGDRRTAASDQGIVLHRYEQAFLDVISASGASFAIRDVDFSDALKELIENVAARMNGYDLEETRKYYRGIVDRSWTDAESQVESVERDRVTEQQFEWLVLDEQSPDHFESWRSRGYYYRPSWLLFHIGLPGERGDACTWLDSTCGDVQDNINLDFDGGVMNLRGIDTATGAALTTIGEGIAESGSYSGGGGGCACACAGCACACACAGGGR